MTLYCRGLQTFFMPQMYVFPWRCSFHSATKKKSSIVDFSLLCAGTCVLVQGSPEKFIFDFLEVAKEHLAQLASALEVPVSLLKGAIDQRSGEKWLACPVPPTLAAQPLQWRWCCHYRDPGMSLVLRLCPPIADRVCVPLLLPPRSLPAGSLCGRLWSRLYYIALVVTYSFIREDCFSSSWVQDLIPGCVHCFSVFVTAHTSQGLCNTTQI